EPTCLPLPTGRVRILKTMYSRRCGRRCSVSVRHFNRGMNMKNIKKKYILLVLCLTIIGFNSCNESRLDVEPGFPTEESYFAEEIEFTRAVYGIYAKMTDFYWYNGSQ